MIILYPPMTFPAPAAAKPAHLFQKGKSGNPTGRPKNLKGYISMHALEQVTGCVGADAQARWCIKKKVPYIRARDRTLLVRKNDLEGINDTGAPQ